MEKYPAARYPINQSGHGKEAVEAAKKEAEEKKEEKKDEKKEGKAEEKKEESLLQLDIYENPYSHYVGNVGSRSQLHDKTLLDDLNFDADGPQRHIGNK